MSSGMALLVITMDTNTIAKVVLFLGITSVTIAFPAAGYVTVPVGFMAGIWLLFGEEIMSMVG